MRTQQIIEWGWQITLWGVPIVVSIGAILVTVVFFFDGRWYVKRHIQGAGGMAYFWAGLVSAIMVMVSLAIHEACHALVANLFHIKIVGAGFVVWGAYVQTGQSFLEQPIWTSLLISLAGPAANWAIAGIAALIVWLQDESVEENTVQYVSYINIRLAKLNLLPIVVLDGGHALMSAARLFVPAERVPTIGLAATIACVLWLLFRPKPKKGERLEDALETL